MINIKEKQILGIIGLIIMTIIWGGGFIAADLALDTYSPYEILAFRFLIASILMIAISRTIRFTKEELLYGSILGFLLFIGFALQTVGLQYTTPSKNAFLTSLYVIFVPFFAVFISKKKLPKINIFCAILSLMGVGILSLKVRGFLNFGDFLTLLCAFAFALQIYLTGVFVKKLGPDKLNAVQMISAFFFSTLVIIGKGDYTIKYTQTGFLSLLYLGLLSTGICYILQTICQQYVSASQTAIILSMEAVFGTIFSVILLNEGLSLRMIVGSIIIFIAVIISSLKGQV